MNRLPLCQTSFASLFLCFSLFLSLLIVTCLKASQAVSHLSSTLFGAMITFSNLTRMKLLGKAIRFDMLLQAYLILYVWLTLQVAEYEQLDPTKKCATLSVNAQYVFYAFVFIYASMGFLFMLYMLFLCFYVLSHALIHFHMFSYAFECFYMLLYAIIRFHML